MFPFLYIQMFITMDTYLGQTKICLIGPQIAPQIIEAIIELSKHYCQFDNEYTCYRKQII